MQIITSGNKLFDNDSKETYQQATKHNDDFSILPMPPLRHEGPSMIQSAEVSNQANQFQGHCCLTKMGIKNISAIADHICEKFRVQTKEYEIPMHQPPSKQMVHGLRLGSRGVWHIHTVEKGSHKR